MAIEINKFLNKPDIEISIYQRNLNSFFHYKVLNKSEMVCGNGSGSTSDEAQIKAVFEMIERTIYCIYSDNDVSSSGWAAHLTLEGARENASFELLERDAVLVSWLLKSSPIFDPRWEVKLSCGISLKPLQFATIKNKAIVMGAVINWNQKKIFISTCCKDIATCLNKLKIDAERSLMIAENTSSIELSSILKMHFSRFSSLNEQKIKWLFEKGKSFDYDLIEFEYKDFKVPLWDGSIAWVSRAVAKNRELQELFWGAANIKNINRGRLAKNSSRPFRLNRELHPII